MSENKLKGTVTAILEPQSGESKKGTWNKQDFVIETDGEYPKDVCFTLFGDKVDMLPKMGETVEVYFNLESREYQGKYFHNVNAWRIETSNTNSSTAENTNSGTEETKGNAADDDLPFIITALLGIGSMLTMVI